MTYPPPGGQDPYQPQQPEPTNPYGQPAYPQPPQQPQQYGQPYGQYSAPQATGNNGLSLASMIVGIVSVLIGCCCGLFGIPVGLVAAVLGFVGLKQVAERGQSGRGMAIAGIATGAAGIILGIIMFALGQSSFVQDWVNDLPGSGSDLD